MNDLSQLTIIDALRGLRAKKFSSVDIVKACLSNIKKYNKEYNVLLTVEDDEKLIEEAKKQDTAGYDLPLSGIPVVLKDIFSTRGLRTTAASKVLDNYVPPYDATVVSKLRDSGAIVMGKANQDAWAHGATGENSDYGPTRNAYDTGRVAGGSSSGSAVAVRMGMCLFATATDTGGSIRVPASFNNLIGLKPTYGRVSRYGIIAMASSLDTIGHITRSVEDSAYVLGITAGHDPKDATTGIEPVPQYHNNLHRGDLKGVKVGISPEYFAVGKKLTKGMDSRIVKLLEKRIEDIKSLGAEIVEVSLPYTTAAIETYYIVVPSEISSNLARYDGIRFGQSRETFGSEAKRRIIIGTYALSSGYYDAYYKTAQKVRNLICADFDTAFQKADIIMAPVSPMIPPKIGEFTDDPLSVYLMDIYTGAINLAGVASLALPAGFVEKLPVGIQLIGPKWSEQRLFDIGHVYEKAIQT